MGVAIIKLVVTADLKVGAGDALCELVEQRHHDLLELSGLDDV